MATHSLSTALTLYGSGTLTFRQAANRAGQTEDAFKQSATRYGVLRQD